MLKKLANNIFGKISSQTRWLACTSFLMNYSTASVISYSLRSFEDSGTLLIVKTLSKALGYSGKFLVGFLTEIFQCNQLILKIGYGSNFIIKPMFYISCLGIEKIVVMFGVDVDSYALMFKSLNLLIFTIADILDQFFNNLRDVSRDTIISSSVDVSDLSRNLYFRKAASFLGTGVGGVFALIVGIMCHNNLAIHIIMICALISSVIGYFCLMFVMNLDKHSNVKSVKFNDFKMLKDVKFILFVVFSVGFWICLFWTKLLFLYFVFSAIILIILNRIYTKEGSMSLMSNKTFMSAGLFTCLFMMFQFSQYGFLKVFDVSMIFTVVKINDSNIQRQIFFLLYYMVSFLSSFIGSMIGIKRVGIAVTFCSVLLFVVNFLPFLSKSNPFFFFLSLILYCVNVGIYEPLMSSHVIKHANQFKYNGITIGLFSVFNSFGVSLNVFLLHVFASNIHYMLLTSALFFCVTAIFCCISNYNKCKVIVFFD